MFRFGHTSPTSGTTLGVYGIGLKRAIFKIGNKIYIQSKTSKDGFQTKLDVQKWAQEETNWKIPLIPTDGAQSTENQGTVIKIEDLHSEIMMRIESGTLLRDLKEQISETYSLFIDRYVQITLNDTQIIPRQIPLGESDQVHAAVDSFEKCYNDQTVKVTLIASLAARSQNKTWTSETAGWYALCNGRMVVSADKTDLTGWTTLLPQYHSKYMGFIGIAFFHSENPHLLPWTTTKQGLNRESQVYQEARNRMAGVARPVLDFLNKMYPSDPAPQTDARKIAEGVTQADILSSLQMQPAVIRHDDGRHDVVAVRHEVGVGGGVERPCFLGRVRGRGGSRRRRRVLRLLGQRALARQDDDDRGAGAYEQCLHPPSAMVRLTRADPENDRRDPHPNRATSDPASESNARSGTGARWRCRWRPAGPA